MAHDSGSGTINTRRFLPFKTLPQKKKGKKKDLHTETEKPQIKHSLWAIVQSVPLFFHTRDWREREREEGEMHQLQTLSLVV